MSVTISTTPTKKHETRVPGGEVPDSEDEEYGWDDDDEEAFLKMPTQWQGSEDILLGKDGAEEEEAPPNGSSEESEEDEGEEDGDDADDE